MPEDSCVTNAGRCREQNTEYKPKEMNAVFTRFFDVLLPVTLLFGGLVAVVSLYRSFRYGLYAPGALHASIYVFSIIVLFFRRRMPVRLMMGLFFGLMALSAVHSLSTLGMASEGMMTISLLCIFACVFFGIRGGLTAIVAGALAAAVIGAGICIGLIPLQPDVLEVLQAPATWLVNIGFFLLFTVPLVFIITFMQKRIADALDSAIKANRQLQQGISTRAAMENELMESEARYRSIVENSLVAFSVVQDGRFRFVNSRFCDMTGYTCEELLDTLGPADIAHPDFRDSVAKHNCHLLAGEPVPTHDQITLLRKDGLHITVKALGNRFTYLGKPAIFGSFIDVTNEKLLESKLIQSQKMEAIGTLASGIAHDFNNILSALMGFGTMLHMALEDRNPLKRYTTNILSASEKAAGLTQSLLTFSRSEDVELEPVKINTIIKDTEDLLRRIITEDIDFRIDLSPEPVSILADGIQMNQILFNLVANARDAMPMGGSLVISTGVKEIDDHFILQNGFGKKGRYCRVSVSDSGIGMEKVTIEKIFDPFFTTKETGKGTGLGLSTVYGIVKRHRGYIQVSSTPGKGSAFHLYFPTVCDVSAIEKKPHKEFRKGHETILVAEDDTTTRCFIRDLLTHFGYNVIEAENGEDALEKYQPHPDISLLILDSIMPGKNGKEVYDTIQKKLPDVRVLFMSGYPRETVLSKGLLDPAMEFMPKPLYPDRFMEKVGEILDGTRKVV